MLCIVFFFFFSSRRRHTRYWRDWSSDVCYSDLKLPIIFCCENNRYGMGTAFERVAAVTDVVEHACSYDMAAELVNGMDALAVYAATERAVERARSRRRPPVRPCR